MGENHIKISEQSIIKDFLFTSFPKQGCVTTFSNAIYCPTDSAASTTALAAGKNVNKKITYHKENLPSITEYAKLNGYGVEIITTDSLDGATPSAFSAHTKNGSDSNYIINDQIISQID